MWASQSMTIETVCEGGTHYGYLYRLGDATISEPAATSRIGFYTTPHRVTYPKSLMPAPHQAFRNVCLRDQDEITASSPSSVGQWFNLPSKCNYQSIRAKKSLVEWLCFSDKCEVTSDFLAEYYEWRQQTQTSMYAQAVTAYGLPSWRSSSGRGAQEGVGWGVI
eukprot:1304480-Prymnesium_polylepis.1